MTRVTKLKHAGGRPRVYGSNAERQKAYRERVTKLKAEKATAERERERVTKLEEERAAWEKAAREVKRRKAEQRKARHERMRRIAEEYEKEAAERSRQEQNRRRRETREARKAAAWDSWSERFRSEFFGSEFFNNPHLETLGLPSGATVSEIKQAYRRLVKMHHPDVGGNAAAFRRVHEAYVALTKGR